MQKHLLLQLSHGVCGIALRYVTTHGMVYRSGQEHLFSISNGIFITKSSTHQSVAFTRSVGVDEEERREG